MAGMRELETVKVRVDDVVYMPSLEAPDDKPHPFVYFISIFNHSEDTFTIKGRKWVVREGTEVTVVEGEGVVGQTPVLKPGQQFSYNSYHVTADDADVQGAFFGTLESGERVFIRIPTFKLCIPGFA